MITKEVLENSKLGQDIDEALNKLAYNKYSNMLQSSINEVEEIKNTIKQGVIELKEDKNMWFKRAIDSGGEVEVLRLRIKELEEELRKHNEWDNKRTSKRNMD